MAETIIWNQGIPSPEAVNQKFEMVEQPVYDIAPGLVLQNKYKLLEQRGEGGMGVVFKAEQLEEKVYSDDPEAIDSSFTDQKNFVAVKFIPSFAMDPYDENAKKLRRQFNIETQITKNLFHDNTLRALAWGVHEGKPYYVMEFVDGYNAKEFATDLFLMNKSEKLDDILEDLLKKEVAIRLPDVILGFIGFCVGNALEDARKKHLLHGDVSPENIFISREYGTVKLGDFGAAQSKSRIKKEGCIIVGKLPYMAPEMMTLSQIPDTRADIFSLGMTLYELILGTTPNIPFNRNVHYAEQLNWIPYILAKNDACGDILPPHRVVADVDERLSNIIAKAIKRNPDERYQTPEKFVEDIKDFIYSKGAGITKELFSKYIDHLESFELFDNSQNEMEYLQKELPFLRIPIMLRDQSRVEKYIEKKYPFIWNKIYGKKPVWGDDYFSVATRELTTEALKKVKAGLNPCWDLPESVLRSL